MVSLVQEFQPSPYMNCVWLQFFCKLHAKLRAIHTEKNRRKQARERRARWHTSIMRRWKPGVGFSCSLGIGAPSSSQLSAAQAQFEVGPGCLRPSSKSDPPVRTDMGPGCWVSPCRRWVSLWSELPYHSADLFGIKPPQKNSQDLEAVPASPEWLQMFISNPGHSSSSRPLRLNWTTLKKFMTSSGWTLCLPR